MIGNFQESERIDRSSRIGSRRRIGGEERKIVLIVLRLDRQSSIINEREANYY